MSDIKLFRIASGKAVELTGEAVTIERSLQTLIERDCATFLGVTFLATEYVTGKTHGGRIDTLGIDEDDCPVIIEYKRATNENVINQGLFYLDWLLDHKAEFKLLVMDRTGKERADAIDWSTPRLLCIAGDFTRYDKHAVQQISRNIDLLRYQKFGTELLTLQLVHRSNNVALSAETAETGEPTRASRRNGDKTTEQALADADANIRDLFSAAQAFVLALGDDVQEKKLKLYVAYARIKNFVSIVTQKQALLIYVKVDPATVELDDNFSRDVREIGHWGTGDLELTIKSAADLARAQPLILRSYEGN